MLNPLKNYTSKITNSYASNEARSNNASFVSTSADNVKIANRRQDVGQFERQRLPDDIMVRMTAAKEELEADLGSRTDNKNAVLKRLTEALESVPRFVRAGMRKDNVAAKEAGIRQLEKNGDGAGSTDAKKALVKLLEKYIEQNDDDCQALWQEKCKGLSPAPEKKSDELLKALLPELKLAKARLKPFTPSRVTLRFNDIPFNPATRVVEKKDLHANYIKTPSGASVGIAAQYPLPGKVRNHLEMMMDKGIQVLMPLVSGEEITRGSNMPDYFRKDGQFGSVSVKSEPQGAPLEFKSGNQSLNVQKYMLTLSREGKTHAVTVMHVENWPDRSALDPGLLKQLVESKEVVAAGSDIVVHCRAGVGRTGCVLAARAMALEEGLSLQDTIVAMRKQRGGQMVQTDAQVESLVDYALAKNFPVLSNKPDLAAVPA